MRLFIEACSMQIVELLAKEKGWWSWRAKAELKRANAFLDTFQPEPATAADAPIPAGNISAL